MTYQLRLTAYFIQPIMQRLAAALLMLTALGLTIATLLAAVGVAPWLEFPVIIEGVVYEHAGRIVQIGGTVLAVMLCFYLPANHRIMQLENSHRRFTLDMRDVARAYSLAHSADRDGLFQLPSEFDSVRERLLYLREHPDLQGLEPDVLDLAAQMSHISQELAERYSDENVDRARTFLKQRQQEIETFNVRLEHAKQVTSELKHWSHAIEVEESIAASQFKRLQDELHEILPELESPSTAGRAGTVVAIPKKAAE